MRNAVPSAETNAMLIRWLSLMSLALLAPYAILVVLIWVDVSNAPPPAPCHALACGPPGLFVFLLPVICVLGPTLGGLLAGALAWLESMQQAVRHQQGLWLIGLLLAGIIVMAPILALVVSAVAANSGAGETVKLPLGITAESDIALAPLLTIPMVLITLLFGMAEAPTSARQKVKTREAVEDTLIPKASDSERL